MSTARTNRARARCRSTRPTRPTGIPDKIGLARYEVWEIPDDTARLNALKTGQIDAGNWLANPQSAIIDRTPGLKLIRNTGGLNYHVVISDREGTVVPAFADRNVRLAMAHSHRPRSVRQGRAVRAGR